MQSALYLLFFLSGAAGLMYESIWARYLTLLVGHGAYAQIFVMTIFLGGMAIGSLVVQRFTERLKSPLAWYAGVEAVIGLLALCFHPTFVWLSGFAYDSLFPALVRWPVAQYGLKWVLAAILILPQSVLLGATFPLMSAGVLRRWPKTPGAILSWLYASNSFGAAVGVLLAGFYLVRRFDFPGTLLFAAVLNLLVAIVTVGLVVQSRVQHPDEGGFPARPATDFREIDRRTLLLGATFLTAVASFAYEIAWIRMLSLVLGSATHSFELMLSAFIFGLALGALWVSRRADRWADPLRALGFVQCAMGALAVLTLPLYIASFGWTGELLTAFTRTTQGYIGFTLARYVICLLIMVPATFCAGMTLPLITRILYRNGANERAIGEVYAVNTAGSIIGVQIAGLALLPLLGLKLLLIGAAALDVSIGLVILYYAIPKVAPSRRSLFVAATVASILIVCGAWSAHFDRSVLASGVFRTGVLPKPGEFATMFYSDGRTATVTVQRTRDGDVILSTNGKPDASVSGDWLTRDSAERPREPLRDDEGTQVLLPLIAIAHAPRARAAAVIGQGSGMSSHFLLGSPNLRELVTIEIEPEMIEASRAFSPLNDRVFSDPRSHFVIDDAKSYFAAAGRKFDLILSEPSNPWVSGVAGLFTQEFYARIRQYLAPGGVFAQWMHLYEMNDGLVRSVLSALQKNFPAYDVYMVGDEDIVIVATNARSVPTPDWSVAQWPMIAGDLRHIVPLTPDALAALEVADNRTLAPFMASARPNSDFSPLLDLNGEKARYVNSNASGFRTLNIFSYDIPSALTGRRLPLGTGAVSAIDVPRLYTRARSARIRLFPTDSTPGDADYAPMVGRRRVFDAQVASGIRPREWHRWLGAMFEIDRDIHAGSAGVVDENLYRPVGVYLARTNAPVAVREAVEFLRAADEWDFPTVVRTGEALISIGMKGNTWLPPEYLRDAIVVAHLKTGDPKAALATFRAVLPFVRRDEIGLFRTRLLSAQIVEALHKAGLPKQ
jgi:predicted membrane-bound spermidine synthase